VRGIAEQRHPGYVAPSVLGRERIDWTGHRGGFAVGDERCQLRSPAEALRKWNPSDLPKWLGEDFYRREIIPRLPTFTVKKIRIAIDVSHPYAALIKRGQRIPHPRHWLTLAELAGYRR
jgi:hypothetical protein